ncbi:hypothetical protein HF086_004853 [Spodoptera exigua]|uniref:Uncharacterized protein n=1 Tax=Spodoptera exigua TaxID=7107 RepID=A0A922M4E1_SPOEX|nr:hypothetical protein HF086_004853 [Spodoptera exigua]
MGPRCWAKMLGQNDKTAVLIGPTCRVVLGEGAESNITYMGNIQRGLDNEDYIVIGPERIAIRNRRIPTYFLQPNTEDSYIIDEAIQKKQSILDHFSNEITAAIMHSVVDNFRLFSMKVPIRHYYKYYK